MAIEGFRPIIEMQMADFVTVALDQIMTTMSKEYAVTGGPTGSRSSSACRTARTSAARGTWAGPARRTPRATRRGSATRPGSSWSCRRLPRTRWDCSRAAVRCDDPVVFMEQKGMYSTASGEVPGGDHVVPIGRAAVVRPGTDVTVVALGAMVPVALTVAGQLAGEGISVEVVDPRTLVPLDEPTLLASVRKTGRAVITHEAHRTGGFGAEIAAVLAEKAFSALRAPVVRCAALDVAIPAGDDALRVLPGPRDLADAVRSVLRPVPA